MSWRAQNRSKDAKTPEPGRCPVQPYILTTCEPYRFINQRDSTWARVFFLARLGLKSTV
jgi:hypothetical protein